MEVESSTAILKNAELGENDGEKSNNPRSRKICLITVGIVLAIAILILILAFTVFRIKPPEVTLSTINLKDMNMSLDVFQMKVNVNVTLGVDLAVKNPNIVGFHYMQGISLLNYRKQLIGEALIPPGKIPAGGKENLNLTLTVMADRFLADSQAFADVSAGMLPVNTYTKVPGEARIIGIKVQMVSVASCDFVVYANKTVGDKNCTYTTS